MSGQNITAFKALNKHLRSLGFTVDKPKMVDWDNFVYKDAYVFVNKTLTLRNTPVFMVKNNETRVGYDMNMLDVLYDEF